LTSSGTSGWSPSRGGSGSEVWDLAHAQLEAWRFGSAGVPFDPAALVPSLLLWRGRQSSWRSAVSLWSGTPANECGDEEPRKLDRHLGRSAAGNRRSQPTRSLRR